MSKIDWSKAPNSAVAVLTTKPDNIHHPSTTFVVEFFRLGCTIRGTGVDGRKLCAIDDCWELIERPAPAWNGKGLPPVGTVCEHKRVHEWQKVEVFAVKPNYNGSQTALFTYESGCWGGCAEPSFFRPIRTPEQIAAEKRQAEIEDMVIALGRYETIHDACEMLYDAGYRKQVAQ